MTGWDGRCRFYGRRRAIAPGGHDGGRSGYARGGGTARDGSSTWSRIGISGWRYAGWRGVLLPAGAAAAPRARLRRRAADERSRSTAPSTPCSGPSSWRSWAEQVPEDFVFAVKGPRFVTHMKKLVDVETPLATFLATGVLSLGEQLGPLLWQLPPNLGFHPDRLAAFFDLLPRTTVGRVVVRRVPTTTRTSSRSLPTPRRRSTARCATCSRCGTPPSAPPSSASCSAPTTSGWWWRTPRARGRCSTR